MSTKIYLASSGSYSDYSVSCAFATLELALEYVAARNKVSVEVQREAYGLSETRPYTVEVQRARHELERKHPRISMYDGYYVEELELWDEVPIA